MMNRKGDSGSPCLTPHSISNSFVGEPFKKKDALFDHRHPCIHLHHLSSYPSCICIESRYSQLIESKALSKSTLKSNVFFVVFLPQEHNSLTINGPSRLFLPSTNAYWTSPILLSMTFFNRLARVFAIILYRHPIRLIGLKSPSVIGSLILELEWRKRNCILYLASYIFRNTWQLLLCHLAASPNAF